MIATITEHVWPIIILMGLGTFTLRFSFLFLLDRLRPSETVLRILDYIPVAVLPAIAAPALIFRPGGAQWDTDPTRVAAGILAALVAIKTKNVLPTILTGMAALAAARALVTALAM